ncbi:MAG: hypothetical protein QM770_02375 [Tepidisphaeraceae bacterium]
MMDFETSAPAERAAPDFNSVADILLLQSADGTFRWNDDVDKAMVGRIGRWADLKQRVTKESPSKEMNETVLALVVLKLAYANEEPLWRRGAAKAMALLAPAAGGDVKKVSAWLDSIARDFAS